jgi:hypothetical protein
MAEKVKQLIVAWGEAELAENQRKRWMGSWLVSREGEEGEYFYDGPGGQETQHEVPAEAIGVRLRWWPNEDTVAMNLEFGPMIQVTDDCFFGDSSEQLVRVTAHDLTRA